MLDRINPYAPHIIAVVGIALYWLKVPYGGLIAYSGFLFTGIYYLAMEIKKPSSRNKFLRATLIILPVVLIVLALQSFIIGGNNFMAIIIILVMYSMIKGKFDQNTSTKES